jgi:hypothetical protein
MGMLSFKLRYPINQLILAGVMLVSGICQAWAVSVSSNLATDRIPLGGSTVLSITVDEASSAQISLPEVEGIALSQGGTSRSTSIINGKVSKYVSIEIRVVGKRTGEFEIPPIDVVAEGKVMQTEAFSIRVTDQEERNQTQSGLTEQTIKDIAFIEIEVADSTLFVGQKVRCSISLFIYDKIRFNQPDRLPNLEHEKILAVPLGEVTNRTVETRNGRAYEKYIWETTFTAISQGELTLSTSMDLPLLLPVRNQRSRLPSLFDSDFFGPSYRNVPIEVESNAITLEISPLPEPIPEGFSGAIGTFGCSLSASPTIVEFGDPITLDVVIAGEGNFERIHFDLFADNPHFKTYTPTESFEPNDTVGFEGIKKIKQAIIPLDQEMTQIPSLEFIYFDSAADEYVTIETPPVGITINQTTIQTSPAQATTDSDASAKPSMNLESEGLIGAYTQLGKSVAIDKPFHKLPSAWIATLLPALLALIAKTVWFAIVAKNQAALREQRKQQRKLRTIEQAIQQAIHANDQSAFVAHCAHYSREILSSKLGLSAQAITSADVDNHLGNRFPAIKQVISANEIAAYSGGVSKPLNMTSDFETLQKEWRELTR